MLDYESVRRIQIAVLWRAVQDYLYPDCDCRKADAEYFFKNPRCEYLYNPFSNITLWQMLEVLKNGER